MISNLDSLAGTQPQLPFVRPVGDDHVPQSGFPNWGSYIVAHSGSEFQIGDYLIRRMDGDKFIIWNLDHEMMQTDAGKLESALREFFNEEF